MSSPMLLDSQALRGDIRTEFLKTLQSPKGQSARLPMLMGLGVNSTQRVETYFYWESLPVPVRWRRGDEIPRAGMRSRSYQVTNYTWARSIEWHEEDAEDDQTRSLVDQGRQLAQEFKTLPERQAFQVLLGSTDPDLLPTVPNAPDGVALFSATDGAGAARFGVTGGNIVTSTGTTAAQRRDDFFSSIERMLQFQGTNGQPFHAENLAEQGFLVVYGAQHDQEFRTAFEQRTVIQTAGAGEAAGVTNLVLDSGLAVTLWPTAYLAGQNAFFVVAQGYPVRPIFQQVRIPVQMDEITRTNSDRARDTRMVGVNAFARGGVGVNLPIGAIKVA